VTSPPATSRLPIGKTQSGEGVGGEAKLVLQSSPMDNPQAYFGRLKPIHIFKGLSDVAILDFANELKLEKHPAGATIVAEGEEGQHFYIINKGRVKVLRQQREGQKHVALLVPGDYFGEAALLYGRRRSATVVAETEVELLALSKEDFDALLSRYPQLKPNLLVSSGSREIYRRLNLDWLSPSEVVYLIARRHPLLLWQALAAPIGLAILLLFLAIGAGYFFSLQLALFFFVIGGLALGGWMAWVYVDWGNDYYIVTNRRVVYLEKIVGIYDSRQEAPLHSVQSVNTQTAGALERQLGIGDVIVRTFSGPITMKSVANPQALAALIEEHWNRTKTYQREAEWEALKQAVRRRITNAGPEPRKEQPVPVPALAQETKKPAGRGLFGRPRKPAQPAKPKPPKPSGEQARFFSFKVRFEQGDTVVYRKHWYVLVQEIMQPSLLILVCLGLVGLQLAGFLPEQLSLGVVLMIAIVGFIPLAGWWLYLFEDWKNDIYQIAQDQIVALHRKPFGEESRKAAPLGNVMSLRYERPGLIGLFLNYGTVIATVAGQEFRFDGVFDPVGVQNDIYRRMEMMNARKAQAEAAKKRDELADWVGVYHTIVTEMNADEARRPPGAQNPTGTGNPSSP